MVLDGVTDPHNLGAVMRSAVSAGATGLVTRRHRAAALTPAALKAAAGAAEYLPVAAVPGIPAALAVLAAAGVWSVALDAGARQPLWDLPVADQPIALVLGGEGRGLGRLVRQRCDLVSASPCWVPSSRSTWPPPPPWPASRWLAGAREGRARPGRPAEPDWAGQPAPAGAGAAGPA